MSSAEDTARCTHRERTRGPCPNRTKPNAVCFAFEFQSFHDGHKRHHDYENEQHMYRYIGHK